MNEQATFLLEQYLADGPDWLKDAYFNRPIVHSALCKLALQDVTSEDLPYQLAYTLMRTLDFQQDQIMQLHNRLTPSKIENK